MLGFACLVIVYIVLGWAFTYVMTNYFLKERSNCRQCSLAYRESCMVHSFNSGDGLLTLAFWPFACLVIAILSVFELIANYANVFNKVGAFADPVAAAKHNAKKKRDSYIIIGGADSEDDV